MEVKASFSARETDDPTPSNRETCYLCSHVSFKGVVNGESDFSFQDLTTLPIFCSHLNP